MLSHVLHPRRAYPIFLTQTLGLTLAIIQRKLREISKQIDVLQDVGRKSAKTKLTEAMTSLEHENYSDAYEAFNKAADKVYVCIENVRDFKWKSQEVGRIK